METNRNLKGKKMNLNTDRIKETQGMKEKITKSINIKIKEIVKIDVDDTNFIAE